MKILISILFCLSALTSFVLAGNRKCRALALEGGGDKGAFQVGAFKAMTEQLHPREVTYDVISGISVGAINAATIGIFPIGNEKAAS